MGTVSECWHSRIISNEVLITWSHNLSYRHLQQGLLKTLWEDRFPLFKIISRWITAMMRQRARQRLIRQRGRPAPHLGRPRAVLGWVCRSVRLIGGHWLGKNYQNIHWPTSNVVSTSLPSVQSRVAVEGRNDIKIGYMITLSDNTSNYQPRLIL